MSGRPGDSEQGLPPWRRTRLLQLAVLVGLGAAALSGSCTRNAEHTAPDSFVTAALISGGIALGIALLFFLSVAGLRRAKIVAVISLASYLAAGFGAWFLFLWPAVAAVIIAVGGGFLARAVDSRSSGATAVISGLAIFVAGAAVVVGFWVNYDLNLGGANLFAGNGHGPSSLNVLPFALITGTVPPAVAIVAALLTKAPEASAWVATPSVGPEEGQARQGITGPATYLRPSTLTVALCLGSVGLCVALAEIAHPRSGFVVFSSSIALFDAGVVTAIGALFVLLTRDRREIWFFAVIGVSAFIVGEFAIGWPLNGRPWGIVPALTVAVMSGRVAAHAAHREFGVSAERAWRPVAIAMAGALAVALFNYWIPLLPSIPLINVLPSAILVAIFAHVSGEVCRRSG